MNFTWGFLFQADVGVGDH